MKTFNDHISSFAWDMVFAGGDTIKEKYVTLYETIDTIVCITREEEDDPYIIGAKGVTSALVVLDGTIIKRSKKVPVCKIATEYKYEQQDGLLYVGYTKIEGSVVKSGFHVYEDGDAPRGKVLICTKKKQAILNLYNWIE